METNETVWRLYDVLLKHTNEIKYKLYNEQLKKLHEKNLKF